MELHFELFSLRQQKRTDILPREICYLIIVLPASETPRTCIILPALTTTRFKPSDNLIKKKNTFFCVDSAYSYPAKFNGIHSSSLIFFLRFAEYSVWFRPHNSRHCTFNATECCKVGWLKYSFVRKIAFI